MTLDLEDLQRKAEAAKEADKTHTGLYPAGVWHVVEYGDEQSPGICVHSGDAWRVCFMATIQNQKDFDQQMAKAQHIATFNPATVLELIAEVERLRANAEKMEKLYRGLSVERGDLQTEFIEMRSERDALKAQVAEERDWQNEIRKVCKEAMGGNTTFIDDDVARAITALKSQRDEMAEALGWIEAQAKAFAQSKMSEQTRSGIRASAWNWVFAVEQKVADIQRRARSSLNKEKTDG